MTTLTMARFIIIQKTNGRYYINFEADGQIIFASESYSSKKGCRSGVEEVKLNAPDEANFERLTSRNGRFYFILKAANGRVVGISKIYRSVADMNWSIEFVKKAAPTASLVENSNQ